MSLTVADANVDKMDNCGLAYLNLRLLTDKTAFNNTGYSINNGTTRANKEHLTCVAC